MSDKLLGSELT